MGSVSSSGFGISLAQGTNAAGVTSIVRAIVLLLIGIYYLKLGEREGFREVVFNPGDDVLYTLRSKRHANAVVGWGFIIDGVTIFFASIGLFVAVRTGRESYLIPWLALNSIYLLTLPYFVFRAVFGFDTHEVLSQLVMKLIYAFVTIYLYIIVLSYYRMLRFNKTGRVLCQPEQPSHLSPLYGESSEPLPNGPDNAKYMPHTYTHLPPPMQSASVIPPHPPPAYEVVPHNSPYPPPPPYSDVV